MIKKIWLVLISSLLLNAVAKEVSSKDTNAPLTNNELRKIIDKNSFLSLGSLSAFLNYANKGRVKRDNTLPLGNNTFKETSESNFIDCNNDGKSNTKDSLTQCIEIYRALEKLYTH